MVCPMFFPDLEVVGGSLGLTAAVAAIPILVFFVLVGALRVRSHWAGLVSLMVALGLAIGVFGMPLYQAFSAAGLGIENGLVPIVVIIVAAVWLHRLMVATGREKDLREVFAAVGNGDVRIQALLIALCFGGLLEGLSGFGVPVAIVTALLLGLGFAPVKAATIALLANTSPVTFAAFGVPLTTAAGVMTGPGTTHEKALEVAQYSALLQPAIALVIPFVLALLIDRAHLRQLLPLALVMGVVEGTGQYLTLHFISFELGGVLPPILTFLVVALMVRIYQPPINPEFSVPVPGKLHPGRVALAVMPYAMVIAVLMIGRMVPAVSQLLHSTDLRVTWPGWEQGAHLHKVPEGALSVGYVTIPMLSQPGFLIAMAAILSGVVFSLVGRGTPHQLGMRRVVGELGCAINRMALSSVTILEVMALSYLMNLSGMVLAIGTLLARTGVFYLLLSPLIGYMGTAVSGSSASANALFGGLQQSAAAQVGLPGAYAVAVNSAGGVIGKLIAPQSLAIAAAAIGDPKSEVALMRRVLGWSLGLLAFMVLVSFGLGLCYLHA